MFRLFVVSGVLVASFLGSVCIAQAESKEETAFVNTLRNTLIRQQLAMCAAFAAPFGPQEVRSSATIEQARATVEGFVDPDLVVLEEGKLRDKKDAIDLHLEQEGTVIKSFDLSDFRVIPITKDVAVLYSRGAIDATRDGQKLAPIQHVTTIWANRKGKWKAVYSTSSPSEHKY